MKKNTVPVVGGIFHRVRKETNKEANSEVITPEVLLFERHKGDIGGGLFEFPGGKVEKGESEKQALIREIEEELGIKVIVKERLGSAEFQGGSGREFSLTVYFVSGPVDEIELREHGSKKWVSRQTVVEEELALGDRPLMRPCFEYLEKHYQASVSF